jgi:biotin operon repressor
MNIPNDPVILLSYINTQLRDNYSSLDDLCRSLCISQTEIEKKLNSVGYTYDIEKNRFR